ncbi:MAG: hypothetical protein WBL58_04565 [Peptococcia bacterium]|jgi:hypothetical protein
MMFANSVDFAKPRKYTFAVGAVEGRSADVSPFTGIQVLLINAHFWYAIGPNKRWSGLNESLEIEKVDCPIVITKDILAKDTYHHLLKSFVTVEGIHDLDLFLVQLERIGGIVLYPFVTQINIPDLLGL